MIYGYYWIVNIISLCMCCCPVRMGKDTRVTYRRRHAYATRSNRRKVVKTPGRSTMPNVDFVPGVGLQSWEDAGGRGLWPAAVGGRGAGKAEEEEERSAERDLCVFRPAQAAS